MLQLLDLNNYSTGRGMGPVVDSVPCAECVHPFLGLWPGWNSRPATCQLLHCEHRIGYCLPEVAHGILVELGFPCFLPLLRKDWEKQTPEREKMNAPEVPL